MNITIHRGAKQIGGTCVELSAGQSRILLDFGLPLAGPDGAPYNPKSILQRPISELMDEGLLPNIPGLYRYDEHAPRVDGIFISHAHLDHYGLLNCVRPDIPIYLSQTAKTLINITYSFTGQDALPNCVQTVEAGRGCSCGEFRVTPYLADHSAPGALHYAIEAGDKTLIYTGDFRGHGRHGKKTTYLVNNAPKRVDALLIEGTMLSRGCEEVKTEEQLEYEAVDLIKKTNGPILVCQSGQNIDRLVTFFRAARKTGRTFVVDQYVAHVLASLNALEHNNLPHPSEDYAELRVLFLSYLMNKMSEERKKKDAYIYQNWKITKQEIAESPEKMILVVRPSMRETLEHIHSLNGGNTLSGGVLVFSQWKGYEKDSETSKLLAFAQEAGMSRCDLHTSGHATPETLRMVIEKLDPKWVIPIHTSAPENFVQVAPEDKIRFLDDGVAASL